jgi:hypothetical protein
LQYRRAEVKANSCTTGKIKAQLFSAEGRTTFLTGSTKFQCVSAEKAAAQKVLLSREDVSCELNAGVLVLKAAKWL